MLLKIKKELKEKSNPERAKILQKFFKTRPGEYGEGDIFWGVKVPETRKIAKKYKDISEKEIIQLLQSKIHEQRLLALLIIIDHFSKDQERIFNLYLKNTKYINNWDLVDISAYKIIGAYLFEKPKNILYQLAQSSNLWEKRIAIVATFYFIKNNEFKDTLKISEILLEDNHHLIQKAIGWMLREVGKRNLELEKDFLKKNYQKIARITFSYATEKLSKKEKEEIKTKKQTS